MTSRNRVVVGTEGSVPVRQWARCRAEGRGRGCFTGKYS
jgi:hypothetical protein